MIGIRSPEALNVASDLQAICEHRGEAELRDTLSCQLRSKTLEDISTAIGHVIDTFKISTLAVNQKFLSKRSN